MNKWLLIIGGLVGIGYLTKGAWFMSKVKNLVKEFEGERLTSYKDVAGKWTIGIGHLINNNERHLIGATISPEESNKLFNRDIKTATNTIDRVVHVPLNESQYAALASFIFNVGATNFLTSTLLKKLNAGDYSGAANEFLRWNKAGGKVVAGLTRRREAEAKLFSN